MAVWSAHTQTVMLRLVINPDTPQAWAVELRPGTLSLGRADLNDVRLDHPSVSSAHCTITATETEVWLVDLGSTAGSFVEGELVERARLRPGQLIRLGEVVLRLESDVPEPVPGPPLPPPLPAPEGGRRVSGPAFCKFHPRAAARFACPKCRAAFCELCVTTRRLAGESKRFCRTCGSACEPVWSPVAAAKPPPGFGRSLPGALIYPFQGSGVMLLIAGTAFFYLLGTLPLLGMLLTGYMFSYAKSIISTTAQGRGDLPDWPDFSNWMEDMLAPLLQLLALLVLFFGPAVIIAAWHPGTKMQAAASFLAAMAFGAFFAPMGILALAMFDSLAALNPIALAWSILRVPMHYLVAAALFELTLALHALAAGALTNLIRIPILPQVISSFLYLYLVAVGMRVLGLLYWTRKDALGWFKQGLKPG